MGKPLVRNDQKYDPGNQHNGKTALANQIWDAEDSDWNWSTFSPIWWWAMHWGENTVLRTADRKFTGDLFGACGTLHARWKLGWGWASNVNNSINNSSIAPFGCSNCVTHTDDLHVHAMPPIHLLIRLYVTIILHDYCPYLLRHDLSAIVYFFTA